MNNLYGKVFAKSTNGKKVLILNTTRDCLRIRQRNNSTSSFSANEVSDHNKKDDCWIIINNNVYDVTEFLTSHPGGAGIILQVGGTDATDYFEELHRPEILDEIAKQYKIGSINNINSKSNRMKFISYKEMMKYKKKGNSVLDNVVFYNKSKL
jgi:cytochrome b involved in lipid metabolism